MGFTDTVVPGAGRLAKVEAVVNSPRSKHRKNRGSRQLDKLSLSSTNAADFLFWMMSVFLVGTPHRGTPLPQRHAACRRDLLQSK